MPHSETMKKIERELLAKELKKHRGNVSATARELGISQSTIWYKMRDLGLVGYARRIRAEHELRAAEKQEAKEAGDGA